MREYRLTDGELAIITAALRTYARRQERDMAHRMRQAQTAEINKSAAILAGMTRRWSRLDATNKLLATFQEWSGDPEGRKNE